MGCKCLNAQCFRSNRLIGTYNSWTFDINTCGLMNNVHPQYHPQYYYCGNKLNSVAQSIHHNSAASQDIGCFTYYPLDQIS